jgi:hypothetical protein
MTARLDKALFFPESNVYFSLLIYSFESNISIFKEAPK